MRDNQSTDELFTPERIAAAAKETARLQRELDITNADHIALWLEANMADSSLGWLACRIAEEHERVLTAPQSHVSWGAGDPDCPPELKAGNGELHTLRCKICGTEDFRKPICRTTTRPDPAPTPLPEPLGQWKLGTLLRKRKGSAWHGRVVGYYSTELTPVGYCLESIREPGSVQIYPSSALEPYDGE